MVVGGVDGLRTAAPTAQTPPPRSGSATEDVQKSAGGAQSNGQPATGTFWGSLCGSAHNLDEHPWLMPQAWSQAQDAAQQPQEQQQKLQHSSHSGSIQQFYWKRKDKSQT